MKAGCRDRVQFPTRPLNGWIRTLLAQGQIPLPPWKQPSLDSKLSKRVCGRRWGIMGGRHLLHIKNLLDLCKYEEG